MYREIADAPDARYAHRVRRAGLCGMLTLALGERRQCSAGGHARRRLRRFGRFSRGDDVNASSTSHIKRPGTQQEGGVMRKSRIIAEFTLRPNGGPLGCYARCSRGDDVV